VVSTVNGQHLLIDSGPLPEAVAASAAIPILFQAMDIPGDLIIIVDEQKIKGEPTNCPWLLYIGSNLGHGAWGSCIA
jgi:predicted acylesterase/phospholipase RssA